MQTNSNLKKVDKERIAAIGTLFFASIVIMLIGFAISIFSMLNNINLPVLNSKVHGVLFGVPIIYLGFRYFLAIWNLEVKVFHSSAYFSLDNEEKKLNG